MSREMKSLNSGLEEDPVSIIAFDNTCHRDAVINFWTKVFGYPAAHNEPGLVIDRKLAIDDGLFWVAVDDEKNSSQDPVVGTIMAGYDGHRGWIYSLAVREDLRKRGLGGRMMLHAESVLKSRGCVKINLQILDTNQQAEAFYEKLGYRTEARISMGKRILK